MNNSLEGADILKELHEEDEEKKRLLNAKQGILQIPLTDEEKKIAFENGEQELKIARQKVAEATSEPEELLVPVENKKELEEDIGNLP